MTVQVARGARFLRWANLIALGLLVSVLSGFVFIQVDGLICGEVNGQNAAGGGAAIGMMALAIMVFTFIVAIALALIWSILGQVPKMSDRARGSIVALFLLTSGAGGAAIGLLPVNVSRGIFVVCIAVLVALSILAHKLNGLHKLPLGRVCLLFLVFPVIWAILGGIFSYQSCMAAKSRAKVSEGMQIEIIDGRAPAAPLTQAGKG